MEDKRFRIVAFEYNPKQLNVKYRSGGVHTANALRVDGFKVEPNSYGWSTICVGPESQIDVLTACILPSIYDMSEARGKAIPASMVRKIIKSFLDSHESSLIKMYESKRKRVFAAHR